MKYLIVILFLLFYYNDKATKLTQISYLKGIELTEYSGISRMAANNEYLVWFEHHKSKLYIYSLTKEKITDILPLTYGRGPGEFQQYMSTEITDDNIIYILDNRNAKFIRIDLLSKKIDDQVYPQITPNGFIAVNKDTFIVRDINNPTSLLLSYSWENNKLINVFNMGDMNMREEFPAPSHRLNSFAYSDKYIIGSPMYLPYIYIFNPITKRLIERRQVAQIKEQKTKSIKYEEGRLLLPPDNPSFNPVKIINVPGSNDKFLIQIDGTTESGFELNKIYLYDIANDKLSGLSLDFDSQPKAIVSNDDYIIIYSKRDLKFYKYIVE